MNIDIQDLDKAVDAANAAEGEDVINAGVYDAVTLAPGEVKKRFRLVKYGEYPVQLANGETGIQVVDRETADELVSNFRRHAGLATFFKGAPIYEGHADDPRWLAENPGHKATAVGRMKALIPTDEGIDVESVFNSAGVSMLSGDAPQYSGHSPRWRMAPIPGRPGYFRPRILWSTALTNTPNIPDSTIALNSKPSPSAPAEPEIQQDTMKLSPELQRKLGLNAEPSEDALNTAILRVLSDKETADANLVTANNTVATRDTEITNLKAAAEKQRDAMVETALVDAINTKRITAEEKPKWEKLLKADFETTHELLSAKAPAGSQTVLNTKAQIDLSNRTEEGQGAEGVDAINSAVKAYAESNGIDTRTSEGHRRAWLGAKSASPDLFKD